MLSMPYRCLGHFLVVITAILWIWMSMYAVPRTAIDTVEPLIKDPPRKGHCMLDLSIRDTVWTPKNYHSL